MVKSPAQGQPPFPPGPSRKRVDGEGCRASMQLLGAHGAPAISARARNPAIGTSSSRFAVRRSPARTGACPPELERRGLRHAEPHGCPDGARSDRDAWPRGAPTNGHVARLVRATRPRLDRFAVIVVEQSKLPHVQTILLTTYTTVGLSVLAHGLSAAPLAARYAHGHSSQQRDRPPPMESVPATADRPRGPIPTPRAATDAGTTS